MNSSTHPAYRPDIDGLRAIAVLSVIGFHAFPQAVSGGFVGVDIFFVISGYLISSIILKSLDHGKFSFRDFYARRIRRIFPALIVVLVASMAFGWFALLADEYAQLGKHIVGGAAFVSNVVLWDEVDYFDTAAELKPLLHLWSLGVEEQFYIVWPLFLFLAWRFRSAVPALILVIVIASFLVNIGTVEGHAAAAFYLPFARFWELLCGGLLAYFNLLRDDPKFAYDAPDRLRALFVRPSSQASDASRRWSDLRSVAGGVLIFVAVFAIDSKSTFPGWLALLPICGTLLLISAGASAWFNRMLLARSRMVFIGLISYPLYLWHWPLLSFARIIGQPSLQLVITLVVVSFLLAWATYRFVEIPVRWRKHSPGQAARMTQALAAVLAGITLVGLAGWQSLLPGRLDAVSRDIALARDDWDYPGDGVVGDSGEGTILFFGDSYIRQYYPRVEELSRSGPWAGKTLVFETEGGCAPYTGIERRGRNCNEWALAGYRLAEGEDVEAVVLGASWAGSLNRGDYYRVDDSSRTILDLRSAENDWVFSRIEDRIRALIKKKKRVYIVLAHPAGAAADPSEKIPDRLAWTPLVLQRKLSLAEHRKQSAFAHDKLRRIAENTGATLIDPALWLCRAGSCETESVSGIPIYCDESHLRASFVRHKVHFLDNIAGDLP